MIFSSLKHNESAMLSPVLFAVLVISFSKSAAASRALSLKVLAPAVVNGIENLQVTTTVTNSGDEILNVLNHPNGPLSLMSTDTFSITNSNGASPSFTGIKVKYNAEKAAALAASTSIGPGQSKSLVHDLSTIYNFTSAGPGQYTFSANSNFFIVNDDGSISSLKATVDTSVATVSGRLAVPRADDSAITKRETYTSCSASQEATLLEAAPAAQTYVANAYAYLLANDQSSPRFTTWFGTFTSADHANVTTHFSNLNTNNYSSYAFDCSCTDYGAYAYVFPDTFGKVYLCDAFWVAPLTGTDSQGGTLVHESTHFIVNAGTQDYVYGQADAETLATTDPAEAIMNADNHEYFAENNPILE